MIGIIVSELRIAGFCLAKGIVYAAAGIFACAFKVRIRGFCNGAIVICRIFIVFSLTILSFTSRANNQQLTYLIL